LVGEAAFLRDHYVPGHITASAVVTAPTGDAVLLVLHKRLKRWLQPGGHIDPTDADTTPAARREVLEETGVEVADGWTLVGLDVHAIPAARGEPDHYHHDLVFHFQATTDELTISDESADLRWCKASDLEGLDPDAALRSAVERALRS